MQEKDHSRLVKVVEEVNELNVRFLNSIVRKMVWKRDGSELILSAMPTAETVIESAAEAGGGPIENKNQSDSKAKMQIIRYAIPY